MVERRLAECVDDSHAVLRDAQVLAVYASTGAVVPARTLAVGVVQHLGGKTRERRSFYGLEKEARHCGAILPEVNDKRLALGERALRHCVAPLARVDDDVAELVDAPEHLLLGVCAVDALPDVRRDRLKRLVEAAAYLPAVRRKYLTLELVVALGLPERLAAKVRRHDSRIVFLAVEDRRMFDRPPDRGFPLVRLRAIDLGRAVGVSDLKNGAEGALLASEVYDLVAPPPGGNLGGEEVLLALVLLETAGDVVGERTARLLDVGEPRLERIVRASRLAVHVDLVNAEACRHPYRRLDLALVLDLADEPARAVSRSRTVL